MVDDTTRRILFQEPSLSRRKSNNLPYKKQGCRSDVFRFKHTLVTPDGRALFYFPRPLKICLADSPKTRLPFDFKAFTALTLGLSTYSASFAPRALQAAFASSSGSSLHITPSAASTAPSARQVSSQFLIHSPSPQP